MARRLKLLLAAVLCVYSLSPAAQSLNEPFRPIGPKKQMTIIIFSGLAGAVLGLSTLSFYGRPQERLVNIPIGAGIGIIIGTAYTAYLATTQPKDFFDSRTFSEDPEIWSMAKDIPVPTTLTAMSAPTFVYSWEF